ncbi:serine protease SohB [Roseovarius halotolerans]|uniref:Putative protease SohB n=2 Tax=Roseovarius halotolerans TaxID=505353 RepID=A0A1X6Z1P1_9RHOB|nr:serine protease SohB [Roseovarius halotolerans]SLN37346.1 putative protease SohB [Roseovarius halotolerans]
MLDHAALFVGLRHSTCVAMKERIPFLNRGLLVAVIRLNGSIGTGSRSQLNDEALAPVIEKAFKRGKPRAVALLINSPGGSPVQSSLIASRIRRLADEKNIPVHAFVEDVAASGGYWLATAAESIWVDEASIVGSIGVISSSFGAPVLLARQGVERRVHSSGRSKSFLDPFLPEKEEDVTRLKGLLEQMHRVFEAQVTSRRGARLAKSDDLFTGEFWLGARAIELGLADGVGHLVPKMKELYGDKVRFAQYGRKRGLFQRFGMSIAGDAIAGIEERAAFARFGL